MANPLTYQIPQVGAANSTEDPKVADALTQLLNWGNGLPTGGGGGGSTIDGVTVSGTPTSGQVITATSGTAANWQTPAAGSAAPAVLWNNNADDGQTVQYGLTSISGVGSSATAYGVVLTSSWSNHWMFLAVPMGASSDDAALTYHCSFVTGPASGSIVMSSSVTQTVTVGWISIGSP
jgi:hypothetical protein